MTAIAFCCDGTFPINTQSSHGEEEVETVRYCARWYGPGDTTDWASAVKVGWSEEHGKQYCRACTKARKSNPKERPTTVYILTNHNGVIGVHLHESSGKRHQELCKNSDLACYALDMRI